MALLLGWLRTVYEEVVAKLVWWTATVNSDSFSVPVESTLKYKVS